FTFETGEQNLRCNPLKNCLGIESGCSCRRLLGTYQGEVGIFPESTPKGLRDSDYGRRLVLWRKEGIFELVGGIAQPAEADGQLHLRTVEETLGKTDGPAQGIFLKNADST